MDHDMETELQAQGLSVEGYRRPRGAVNLDKLIEDFISWQEVHSISAYTVHLQSALCRRTVHCTCTMFSGADLGFFWGGGHIVSKRGLGAYPPQNFFEV